MTAAQLKPRPYRLTLHWDSQTEPLVADAARLATLLSDVTAADSASAEWDIAVGSGTERIVAADAAMQLLRALESQRETWRYGEQEFTACKILLLNSRAKPKRIQLTATCGAFPRSTSGIWFANQLALDLWAPRVELAEPAAILNLFCEACRLFTPCWGCVAPPDSPPAPFPQNLMGVPSVGWMTYLAPEYSPPVPTVAGATSYLVEDTGGGQCLVATQDWLDLNNPLHVAALAGVRAQLAANGSLRPRTAET